MLYTSINLENIHILYGINVFKGKQMPQNNHKQSKILCKDFNIKKSSTTQLEGSKQEGCRDFFALYKSIIEIDIIKGWIG